eukprot:Em0083g10a
MSEPGEEGEAAAQPTQPVFRSELAGASRPLVSPDSFSGLSNWAEWIDHFEAAALVNGWDSEKKRLWLPVRLTGKAQTAWKRLSPETKQNYRSSQGSAPKTEEPKTVDEAVTANAGDTVVSPPGSETRSERCNGCRRKVGAPEYCCYVVNQQRPGHGLRNAENIVSTAGEAGIFLRRCGCDSETNADDWVLELRVVVSELYATNAGKLVILQETATAG